MGIQKKWSQEEIDYLQDHWGVISVKAIAKHLNRSIDAVTVMKNRLGLGPFLENGDYITWNQLLHALGYGQCCSSKAFWIKNTNFPIKYKTRLNHRFKVVVLTDFWKWAEKNRSLIDWSKVEKNILGPEPEWVQTQRKVDYFTKLKIKTTPWTTIEDNLLKNLLKEFKYSYKELSDRLQRSEGAIQRRIIDLGLKERPLKADNHIRWTDEEYSRLAQMIKQGFSYKLISDALGKSSKAIRGRVYDMYLTENLDKVAEMIGGGGWGDGRPERPITHRLLNSDEKKQVKRDIAELVRLLRLLMHNRYEDSDSLRGAA